ncbi:hypothetical protein SDC9_203237 [bioreactor metagenome]|uniref:Uncharacterized protein n=1 Tax=bioreactor metagenome TaxID=1076179 RepID=A0A645J7T7_9ZZZZ
MVAALELDQDVAAGETARQADRAHRRLGAGRNQAHHVERRHHLAQQVGDVDFALGRRAEGQTVDDGFLHGGDDFRVGVAEDHRPPGADVVGVPLAVGVLHLAADTLLEEQRRAADRTEGAHRRIDAAGDVFLGTGKEFFVTRGHVRLSRKDVGIGRYGRRCPAPRRGR